MFDRVKKIIIEPQRTPISDSTKGYSLISTSLKELKDYQDSTITKRLLSLSLNVLNEEGLLPWFQSFGTKRLLVYSTQGQRDLLSVYYEREKLKSEEALKGLRHENLVVSDSLQDPKFSVDFSLDVKLGLFRRERILAHAKIV